MSENTITNFLNEQYAESALYMTYRSIPNYCDGLKNSHRKVVYVVRKQNIKNELKVSALASSVVAHSGYIHGDVSLQGVVVTLARGYVGSNNLPILKGEGNFGTRLMNDASAARYIFAHPQDYFDLLFRKEDDPGLISQNFEGEEIEPRFYTPTLPIVLINGSVGIGVGFSTNILARSEENMIKAIKTKLAGGKVPRDLFVPYWRGFRGSVEDLGSNRWKVKGLMERNKKKVHITEIPISYQLKDYLRILEDLEEQGVIDRYSDLSDPTKDQFEFEVTLSSEENQKPDEKIFEDLRLADTITESLTCTGEENTIEEFNSAEEIFNKYFDVKIKYLKIRISNEIVRLTKEAEDLRQIHTFIEEVIKGKIVLKEKRAVLEEKLQKKGYTIIDRLLAMPLYSLTEEKAAEAKKKYEDKVAELEIMKNETPEDLWKKDINEFTKKRGIKC